MSGGVVDLRAQVESVLGALVKAATVELTKLFESRYGVLPVDVDVEGRNGDRKAGETVEALDRVSMSDTKRSIGIQVEDDIVPPLELSEDECGKGGELLEECLIPSEVLLAGDGGPDNPEGSTQGQQVLPDAVDVVNANVLESEFPVDSEDCLNAPAETLTEKIYESTQSPVKLKPIVIQPDTSNSLSDGNVKFVCPLIFKPESPAPKPDSTETLVKAEPQQSCVSTARGTAYSPSPSDGAVTPGQVGVWERIHTPKETKNNLHMTLKLTSRDQKHMLPCTVQLVDVLAAPEAATKLQDHFVNHKAGLPLPKDLRWHQGLHTGHRICCFTSCGNGVWRLQSVVAHSRNGYACSICGKTFRRRKILRRHERFHTGEKPYSCSSCSKTFALRKSLRRHLRFHTGERPHACAQCGKSFRLRENLKAHLRFHSGEKPFSCATCGKMFRIMRNLEKHKLADCELREPSFRTIAGL